MTHGDLPEHDASTHTVLRIKRWLLAFLGMGFLGLTLDVFLEHYFTIRWLSTNSGLLNACEKS